MSAKIWRFLTSPIPLSAFVCIWLTPSSPLWGRPHLLTPYNLSNTKNRFESLTCLIFITNTQQACSSVYELISLKSKVVKIQTDCTKLGLVNIKQASYENHPILFINNVHLTKCFNFFFDLYYHITQDKSNYPLNAPSPIQFHHSWDLMCIVSCAQNIRNYVYSLVRCNNVGCV